MKLSLALACTLLLPGAAALHAQQSVAPAITSPDPQGNPALPPPPPNRRHGDEEGRRPGGPGAGPMGMNDGSERGMRDPGGRRDEPEMGSRDFGARSEEADERGMEMDGEWWRNPATAARVGLTPDQGKRLADLSLQGRLQRIQMDAALETEEVRLEPLLDGPTVDPRAATAQIDRIADARAALEKAEGRNMLAMRAVLTPEQWTRLQMPEPRGMGQTMSGQPMPTPGQR